MPYQNFNTNIADPINYSSNKFESIGIALTSTINFHRGNDYNIEYKKVGILVQILALLFIIVVITSILITAMYVHSSF